MEVYQNPCDCLVYCAIKPQIIFLVWWQSYPGSGKVATVYGTQTLDVTHNRHVFCNYFLPANCHVEYDKYLPANCRQMHQPQRTQVVYICIPYK